LIDLVTLHSVADVLMCVTMQEQLVSKWWSSIT